MIRRAGIRLLIVSAFGGANVLLFSGCGTTSTRALPAYERPLAKTNFQTVRTTAYTHTEADHIKHGRSTALGTQLQCGQVHSAAADWSRWPAGTAFRLISTGQTYRVDDYGWALAGRNTIDLYMPNQREMNSWGARQETIQIMQWGDPQESLQFLRRHQDYRHIKRMVLELEGHHEAAAALR